MKFTSSDTSIILASIELYNLATRWSKSELISGSVRLTLTNCYSVAEMVGSLSLLIKSSIKLEIKAFDPIHLLKNDTKVSTSYSVFRKVRLSYNLLSNLLKSLSLPSF